MTCLDWMEQGLWVWARAREVPEVGVTAMDPIPCLAGMAAGDVAGLGVPAGDLAGLWDPAGLEVSDGASVGAEVPAGVAALAGGFGPAVPLGGEGAVIAEAPGQVGGK